ncbi:MAG: type I 3-dehydroquinate dehydratase [Methanotrichaceae archaeon]|nr:type I 3-dehydroquinate dehydratase [Methanotrichaceae archaeon]
MRDNTIAQKSRIVASIGRNALRDIKTTENADIVELRLDLVEGNPLETLKEVRKATSIPIIATNRLSLEGGQFQGSEQERIMVLQKASDYADYVDIELRAELRDDLLDSVDKPAIVSHHDFIRTPPKEELSSILREISGTRAEIAKIAVTPSRLKDNLLILDFLLESEMPLCMIAMGKLGKHLRALSSIYGSVLTYGYISQPTAPGQMSVSELRQAINLLI